MGGITLNLNVNFVAVLLSGSAGVTPISVMIVILNKIKEIMLLRRSFQSYNSAEGLNTAR